MSTIRSRREVLQARGAEQASVARAVCPAPLLPCSSLGIALASPVGIFTALAHKPSKIPGVLALVLPLGGISPLIVAGHAARNPDRLCGFVLLLRCVEGLCPPGCVQVTIAFSLPGCALPLGALSSSPKHGQFWMKVLLLPWYLVAMADWHLSSHQKRTPKHPACWLP